MCNKNILQDKYNKLIILYDIYYDNNKVVEYIEYDKDIMILNIKSLIKEMYEYIIQCLNNEYDEYNNILINYNNYNELTKVLITLCKYNNEYYKLNKIDDLLNILYYVYNNMIKF